MSTPGYAPAERADEQVRARRAAQVSAAPTLAGTSGPTVDLLRHLQRTVGNSAVNALLRQYRAQGYAAATTHRAALTPGAVQRCGGTPCACSPEERLEHAAGDTVRRMASGTTASRATAHPLHETAAGETTGETTPDGADEELAQAAPEVGLEGGPLSPELTSRINSKRGGRTPLDAATRAGMEAALGTSLADVRVHTDGESHALNRAVSARAFTTGSDIFLGAGASADTALMAHELTHVVQQRGTSGASGPLTVGPADDSYEHEAEAMSALVQSRSSARRSLGTQIGGQVIRRFIIQRDADSDDDSQQTQLEGDSGPDSSQGPAYSPAPVSSTDQEPNQNITASSGFAQSGVPNVDSDDYKQGGQNYTPADGESTDSQGAAPDDGGGGMSTKDATCDSGSDGSDGSDGGQCVAPPAQQDGDCDSLMPSDKWSVTTVSTLSAADGVAVGGIAFSLKDMQPGGCEHHMSFMGVGLGLGGKIKGKSAPLTLSAPSATPFRTQIPVTMSDFNCFGRLWMASIDVGVGTSVGHMQFSAFKTDPEWLDIGGFEGGLGAGEMALVGRFIVS